ncbi:hypothetical protein [Amycolatopsis sp. NBC_01480]|uniref:hypothetical protein n=1 Tax=Amycolatopsis sp. NBC_01480 TaxID=2903562 RepID=UPI002E2A7785|nr:hypothetical protein [Amycolatopsis sp. NBC_01480]
MPHGEDPLDTHAMGAVWRLQQQLHQLRYVTGRSTEDLAAALGLRPFDFWQLENSPRATDAALINVMLYARFFSCRIVFQLTPLDNGEVTGMGKVVREDGTVVYDGNTETGDDEQHTEGE